MLIRLRDHGQRAMAKDLLQEDGVAPQVVGGKGVTNYVGQIKSRALERVAGIEPA